MRTLLLFIGSAVASIVWLVTEHHWAFIVALAAFCLLAWEAIRPDDPDDDLAEYRYPGGDL